MPIGSFNNNNDDYDDTNDSGSMCNVECCSEISESWARDSLLLSDTDLKEDGSSVNFDDESNQHSSAQANHADSLQFFRLVNSNCDVTEGQQCKRSETNNRLHSDHHHHQHRIVETAEEKRNENLLVRETVCAFLMLLPLFFVIALIMNLSLIPDEILS